MRKTSERTGTGVLREATREQHEAAEAAMEARFFPGGEIDREGFEGLLTALLGFHRPLEAHLAPAAERHLEALTVEGRASRLERDLALLGRGPRELAATPEVPRGRFPRADGPARLLGCLYVVEGGELGARVLWPMFRASLPEEALRADAFFGTDPDRARERWRRFGRTFERRVEPGRPLEEAVDAARSTFRVLREWVG